MIRRAQRGEFLKAAGLGVAAAGESFWLEGAG